MAEQHSIVYMYVYRIFFHRLSFRGRLGCVRVLAIVAVLL